MTPAEFIEDIKRSRSHVDDRNVTMVLSLSAVGHLLAIHAAVVEHLDARQLPIYRGMKSPSSVARTKLAELCGWEAKT